MTKILNEKILTKIDFSKGVIELTEWEEKVYQQGKADGIDKCIKHLAKSEDTILSDKQYYALMELKE